MILALLQWVALTAPVDLTPQGGHQSWSRVGSDGAVVWAAWHSAQDVYLQPRSWPTLAPIGAVQRVNVTTLGVQDEPELVVLRDGNVVVAWSDRYTTAPSAYYMTARARVFDSNGNALTGEFALTHDPVAVYTSWRPLLDTLRDGGWVASWTQFAHEKCYARDFDASGAARGLEFALQPSVYPAKQNSPDVCEGRFGARIATFLDGNALSPKDAAWSALDGNRAVVRGPVGFAQQGHQLDVRIASDRAGQVVTAWQSPTAQGFDVFCRRGSTGPVVQVTALPGDQQNVELELSDFNGGLLVWSDDAAARIQAQAIAPDGTLAGAPFAVSGPLGDLPSAAETWRRTPDVWVSDDGTSALVAWGTKATSGTMDAFAVAFVR